MGLARPLRWAVLLFAVGMAVLVSPVTTSLPREGQQCSSNGDCLRLCGFTLTQAFATPRPEARALDRTSVEDCAASARARVGYGVFLLLAAVPFTVSAGLAAVREKPPAASGRSVGSGP